MGRPLLLATLALMPLRTLLTVASLFLPFYSFSFSSEVEGGVTMVLHALSMAVNNEDESFCKRLEEDNLEPEFCKTLQGSVSVETAAEAFCLPRAKTLLRFGCVGLGSAYSIGVCLVLAALLALMLDGAVAYFMNQWLERSTGRSLAFLCQVAVVPLLAIPLLLYYRSVIQSLDQLRVRGTSSFMYVTVVDLEKERRVGMGYKGLWVAVLVQVAGIVLSQFIASEHVRSEPEARAFVEAEMVSFDSGARGRGSTSRGSSEGSGAAGASGSQRPSRSSLSNPVPPPENGVPFEKKASFTVGRASMRTSVQSPPQEWGKDWEGDQPPEDVEAGAAAPEAAGGAQA